MDFYKLLTNKLVKDQNKELTQIDKKNKKSKPSSSEIPDLFFDQILVEYTLERIEIMVLMYLYRQVWCRPNMYKLYGISQLLPHPLIAQALNISDENVEDAIKKVEDHGFISTIRTGQYFVRKYFSKKYDDFYDQTYDSFGDR